MGDRLLLERTAVGDLVSLVDEASGQVSRIDAMPVRTGDTPLTIAERIRAYMTRNAALSALGTVGGTGNAITLTKKAREANDAALNIALATGTAVGLTPVATSTNTTAGVAAVKQVETLTVAGTISLGGKATVTVTSALFAAPRALTVDVAGTRHTEELTVLGAVTKAGNAKVTVTSDLLEDPVVVSVSLALNDTATQAAGKIITAVNANATLSPLFVASGTTAKINFSHIAAAAGDVTFNMAVENDTCEGLTPVLKSRLVAEGVAPDTVNIVATKIRTGLAALIGEHFTIGGTNAAVVITAKVAAANDATLNMALAHGTVTGLTDVANSTNTTAGVAGVNQVETITVAGTITASGEIEVTITATTGLAGSPLTIKVPVHGVGQTSLANTSVERAAAITPSDAAPLSAPTLALFIGTDGDVKVDLAVSGTGITFKNLAAGQFYPIRATKVYATGTTATNIVGVY